MEKLSKKRLQTSERKTPAKARTIAPSKRFWDMASDFKGSQQILGLFLLRQLELGLLNSFEREIEIPWPGEESGISEDDWIPQEFVLVKSPNSDCVIQNLDARWCIKFTQNCPTVEGDEIPLVAWLRKTMQWPSGNYGEYHLTYPEMLAFLHAWTDDWQDGGDFSLEWDEITLNNLRKAPVFGGLPMVLKDILNEDDPLIDWVSYLLNLQLKGTCIFVLGHASFWPLVEDTEIGTKIHKECGDQNLGLW